MIKNKKMKYMGSSNGLDYYLFTPSLFRLYYEKRDDDAVHTKTLSHKVHMCLYLIRGGYSVLYALKDDEVISYFVFTRSSDRIVAGTSDRDFYTVFYWTYPEHRGCGYATEMADYLLNNLSLDYDSFYKTILKSNTSSIRVTEKLGFERIGAAQKEGLLHRICLNENGGTWLYKYVNKRNNAPKTTA